ncbi:glycosyltransferase family 4 protein [Flavobacteriaceae bacterium]|nr:glycosyltransferase family 4 protein [Flavobacteriaceae bacterium]
MVESGKTLIVPLIRNLPDKSGGIQKGVFQLYDNLRANGFDVEFILNSNVEKVTLFDGFKINHLKFPPIYTYPLSKRYFEYSRCKKKIFNYFKNNYQKKKIIVIAHWAPDFFLLSELGCKFGFKTIFSFQGPYHTKKFILLYNRNQFWLRHSKKKLDTINQFIFISDDLFNNAMLSSGIPKDKSIVISNGIVVNDKVSANNNNNLKIVMATRLVTNKNIDFVLNTLSILKTKGLNFVCDIYGDGPEGENIKTLILVNNLKEFVFLKGYSANIDQLLFKYDYYISASLFEGMPRGPLEAINNNVIPILSDIPIHREIIPEDLNIFFSLDDNLSLAKKITEIIDLADEDRDSLKKELRRNLIGKYDIEIRFQKFQNLFKSLIK